MLARTKAFAKSLLAARHERQRADALRATRRLVSKHELRSGIDALGIDAGDAIMLHSSLKSIGFVDGGARTVLDALIEAVGPSGTLVVPTYWLPGGTILATCELPDYVFDPRRDGSHLGRLPSEFLTFDGIARSIHPTHSVSAIGRHARDIVEDHHRAQSIFGAGSPWDRCHAIDAKVMGLGISMGPVTFYHLLEDRLLDRFPLPVRMDRSYSMPCRDWDGRRIEVPVVPLDPQFMPRRIDAPTRDDLRQYFRAEFDHHGLLRWGQVGEADSWVIPARRFYSHLETLVADDITIYSTPERLAASDRFVDGCVMRHWLAHAKDRLGLSYREPQSIETHLAAAAAWTLEAQRASDDDGVAHSYDLRTGRWTASYPETTGYLIPTLYDYAAHFDAPQYRDAALKMARWEVAEQLPDGGIRAGTMAAHVVAPTVFNTGQVLFGLARAARESGDASIRTSLVRAADWLVAAQDDDGGWRRFPSPFAETKNGTYNTRSAFGLVRAHEVTGDHRYLESADRNVRWALSTAAANGWLPGNCLTIESDDRALTHTIAYSIRGILEVGAALDNARYVDAAVAMAARVASRQNADGSLSGYLSPAWEPVSNWSCLTGNAQMALNWLRIAKLTGDHSLKQNAIAANRFNMRLQKLDGPATMRGAIKGSHPIGEDYMTWRFPNWATKFFIDALMFERLFDRVDNIG